ICEVLNPTNCDTADAVFTITAAPIDAVADTYGPINGYTGATTASVLANDTLNGVVVTPSEITLTGVTVPTGFTLNADGTISVASGTPAGTYTVTYSICEVLNPTNCDTADAVFTVVPPVINAVNDDYSSTLFNGVVGGIAGDITLNDTLNGSPVLDTEITITLLDNDGISGLTIDVNGSIFIPAGTPAGSYLIQYQICEILNTTNCDVATVAIVIGNCLDFPINDCDGDGVTNGQEAIDGTDPSNPCDLVALSQDTTPNLTWLQGDCDGDGVSNGQEIIDGTNPIDSCDYQINHVLLPQGGLWLDADCDGDGVTNGQEVIDGTDTLNPCESIEENVTLPQSEEFLDSDCDGDGLTNGEEIGNNPNIPNDANGNGIPDYLEINNHSVSEDELEIFNLVTPNGDGDNDVFVIRNIELYPNNSVEIYNRWGVLVYETKGYGQNQKYFRGVSEGRVTINQASELSVGTYFYIVKYVNNQGDQKERSGYLYINR
ncbi:MAG: gliding motility-associated C-terminal domain-containing protein, partial [Flavobacterium sp.]|nr:gliding motility-associated C-terminal domain-containing protein [Flavobacterium sp.]